MSMRRNTGRDRRGGGTVPFSIVPYYSQGVDLDLNAELGITKDGSNRISSWADQSGAGNTVIQSTGANQPLWLATDTPQSKPVVSFDDVNRQLVKLAGATAKGTAAFTLFMVVKVTANGRMFYDGNGGGTGGVTVSVSAGNILENNLGSTSLTDGARSALYEVWCWRLAASGGFASALDTKELYINGASKALAGTPNMTSGAGTIILGQSASTPIMNVARVIAARSTLLSVSDCTRIWSYLMSYYGTG